MTKYQLSSLNLILILWIGVVESYSENNLEHNTYFNKTRKKVIYLNADQNVSILLIHSVLQIVFRSILNSFLELDLSN